jgi:hypothetical protein
MGKKIDPAVRTYVTYKRAKWIADFTVYRSQATLQRDLLRTDRAADAHFAARPTSPRGALCHLFYALRCRFNAEDHAADWHADYREIVAGRTNAVIEGTAVRLDIVEAARYASFSDAAKAAPLLLRALRLLVRRQLGAVALVRQALAIVREHPLPDADNEAIERHIELALAFLATPRAV